MPADFDFMKTEMALAEAEATAKASERKQRALMEFQLENQLADTEAKIEAFKKTMEYRRKNMEAQAQGAGGDTTAGKNKGPFPNFTQMNLKDAAGPLMRPKGLEDAMSAVAGGSAAQMALAQGMGGSQVPGQPQGMGGVPGMQTMGAQPGAAQPQPGPGTGAQPSAPGGMITGGLQAPATKQTTVADYGVPGLSPVRRITEDNVLSPGDVLMAQLREKEVDLGHQIDERNVLLNEQRIQADIYMNVRNSVRDSAKADLAIAAIQDGRGVKGMAEVLAGTPTIAAEELGLKAEEVKIKREEADAYIAYQHAQAGKIRWLMDQHRDLETNIMKQPATVIAGIRDTIQYTVDSNGNPKPINYDLPTPSDLGTAIDNITGVDGKIRNENALLGIGIDFLDHGIVITYQNPNWISGPNHGRERLKDIREAWQNANGWGTQDPVVRKQHQDFLVKTGLYEKAGEFEVIPTDDNGYGAFMGNALDDYFDQTIVQGRTHTPEPYQGPTETSTVTTVQRRQQGYPVGSAVRGAVGRGIGKAVEAAPGLAERAVSGTLGAGERWISDVRGRLKKGAESVPQGGRPWAAADEAEKQRRREWFKKITGTEF